MTDSAQKATHQGVQQVRVEPDNDGQRIDNFLRARLPGVPKSRVYRLLRTGQVRVNGGRVKAMHRLNAGDQVRIPPVRLDGDGPRRPPDAFLDEVRRTVVYDDGDVMVLDKPSGMAVHSGSGVPFGIADALTILFGDARLVHRLDRPTSGCLIVARQRRTLNALQRQFKEGSVTKQYLTLVRGKWVGGSRELTDLLARESGDRRDVVVSGEGKQARALFEPLGVSDRASYLSVVLHTGRTHQIRVQAAHAGHPVAGDGRYGDPEFNASMKSLGLNRLFLHAHRVSLSTPEQGDIDVESPLPEPLGTLLDALELG